MIHTDLQSLVRDCHSAKGDPYAALAGINIGVHPADLYRLCHSASELSKSGINTDQAFDILRDRASKAEDHRVIRSSRAEAHVNLAESKGFKPEPSLVVTLLNDAQNNRDDQILRYRCISTACKCLNESHESFNSSNDLKTAWARLLAFAAEGSNFGKELQQVALAKLGERELFSKLVKPDSVEAKAITAVLDRNLRVAPGSREFILSLNALRNVSGINPGVDKFRETSAQEDLNHATTVMHAFTLAASTHGVTWANSQNAALLAEQIHETSRIALLRIREGLKKGEELPDTSGYRATINGFKHAHEQLKKQLANATPAEREGLKGLSNTVSLLEYSIKFMDRSRRSEDVATLPGKFGRMLNAGLDIANDLGLAISRFEINLGTFREAQKTWSSWLRPAHSS